MFITFTGGLRKSLHAKQNKGFFVRLILLVKVVSPDPVTWHGTWVVESL